tara:strand:+ start:260 stop:475 length:216 start_codon:yes stop_codon:yes gene_type:complete
VPKFAMPALLNVKSMMKNYVKLAPKHVENVQQPAENAVNEKLLWYKKKLMPQKPISRSPACYCLLKNTHQQ